MLFIHYIFIEKLNYETGKTYYVLIIFIHNCHADNGYDIEVSFIT